MVTRSIITGDIVNDYHRLRENSIDCNIVNNNVNKFMLYYNAVLMMTIAREVS